MTVSIRRMMESIMAYSQLVGDLILNCHRSRLDISQDFFEDFQKATRVCGMLGIKLSCTFTRVSPYGFLKQRQITLGGVDVRQARH
jgi:hypothetical protein